MSNESTPVAASSLSSAQRRLLERARGLPCLAPPDASDLGLCIELWRAGLLRSNGEAGFRISRLGCESLARSSPQSTAPAG